VEPTMAFSVSAAPVANTRKNNITVTVTSAVKTNLTYTYTIGTTFTSGSYYVATTSEPTTSYSVKVASAAGCSLTKTGDLNWWEPTLPTGFTSSPWCGNIKVTSPYLRSTSCGHNDVNSSCVINTDYAVYVNPAYMNAWPQCTSPWRDPTENDLSALSACAAVFPNPKQGHALQPNGDVYEKGKYSELVYKHSDDGKAYWYEFIRCDSNSCWLISNKDYHWLTNYRCIYVPD
jgi:hypothetical protein